MNPAAEGGGLPRSRIVGTNIDLSSLTFHWDLNRQPPPPQLAAADKVQITKRRGFSYE